MTLNGILKQKKIVINLRDGRSFTFVGEYANKLAKILGRTQAGEHLG